MTWENDRLTVRDGRQFMIQSEHVRGEGRFYTASQYVERETGGEWIDFGIDGSYRKATVKARTEAHIRKTQRGPGPRAAATLRARSAVRTTERGWRG